MELREMDRRERGNSESGVTKGQDVRREMWLKERMANFMDCGTLKYD
jgi:hypothetical protein